MNIITCALPYANGNLHIGHFFEATLADIKARYLRTQEPTIFISGNDCHGAATTLYCHQHQLDVETHLSAQHDEHIKAYQYLNISFDNFSQTNTLLHHKVVNWCIENIKEYEKITGIKFLDTKDVLSWYDNSSFQFLPDRYVKGECPHCGAVEQPPEVCEICSKAISAKDLISPYSVVSKESVQLKKTKHLVLNCHHFYDEVKKSSHLLHPSIRGKLLDNSLETQTQLDISRDSPYYGIPVEGFSDLENQYFYVWLDAPIAYLTFAFELTQKEHTKQNFNNFLKEVELEHFIGKDIAYFHSFLWINLLKIISHEKGTVIQLNLHGWVTLNQSKFSKSKGDSYDLSQLTNSQIDALRLYFFSKSDGSISDFEYNEVELINTYNQLIVNGLANFYARSTKILEKNNINFSLDEIALKPLYSTLLNQANYKKLYELLQKDLAALNIEFQQSEIWKCADKSIILESCTRWLKDWYTIYQVLCFVCPNLINTHVPQLSFTHLANRLKEESLLIKQPN